MIVFQESLLKILLVGVIRNGKVEIVSIVIVLKWWILAGIIHVVIIVSIAMLILMKIK